MLHTTFSIRADKQQPQPQQQNQQQSHSHPQHQQQQPPQQRAAGGGGANAPQPDVRRSPAVSALESTSGKIKDTLRQSFDPFPSRKGLAERTPLIRHSGPRLTQEELQRQQNAERSSSNSDNQAYLGDVVAQVLAGEGVGWLKLNRLRKLMEDESYRMLVLGKLNRTLDRKIAPDDHVDDVCVPKPVWKGMLKCLLAAAHGLDATYGNYGLGGMASVFQLMEIAHTHFWSKDLAEAAAGGGCVAPSSSSTGGADLGASLMSSRSVSPMGSRENLRSPQSPTAVADWGPPGSSRKNSMAAGDGAAAAMMAMVTRRASDVSATGDGPQQQSTTEMFKDMLSQKRTSFMNKLSSFDSEVSEWFCA